MFKRQVRQAKRIYEKRLSKGARHNKNTITHSGSLILQKYLSVVREGYNTDYEIIIGGTYLVAKSLASVDRFKKTPYCSASSRVPVWDYGMLNQSQHVKRSYT